MSLQFYLIDDDASTRRMLERIIHDACVGEVVGQANDGVSVKGTDLRGVDIVLIDLLMPKLDGIETIRKLRDEGFTGRFIMISQVENKEMVGEAYSQGIDTFIHKPINRIEVLSVLQRVQDHIQLEKSLYTIRRSLETLGNSTTSRNESHHPMEKKLSYILAQLGMSGELGSVDITECFKSIENKETLGGLRDWPPLKEIYIDVIMRRNPILTEPFIQKEIKAMEQRIRRSILQALTHLASLGLTDYSNPTFEHYAPLLFDFQDVRIRMAELEEGLTHSSKSRIQIRKFLYSLYQDIHLT